MRTQEQLNREKCRISTYYAEDFLVRVFRSQEDGEVRSFSAV